MDSLVRIDKNDLPEIILPGKIEEGIKTVPADCNLTLVFHQGCKVVPVWFLREKKDILPDEGSYFRFLNSITDQHMPNDTGVPHGPHQTPVNSGKRVIPLFFIIIKYIMISRTWGAGRAHQAPFSAPRSLRRPQ